MILYAAETEALRTQANEMMDRFFEAARPELAKRMTDEIRKYLPTADRIVFESGSEYDDNGGSYTVLESYHIYDAQGNLIDTYTEIDDPSNEGQTCELHDHWGDSDIISGFFDEARELYGEDVEEVFLTPQLAEPGVDNI